MEFNAVALNVAHGYSPMAFAMGLFDNFEVYRFSDSSSLDKIPDAGSLVHDNIVMNRSIEDIVLKPLSKEFSLSVEQMVLPLSTCLELARLRA